VLGFHLYNWSALQYLEDIFVILKERCLAFVWSLLSAELGYLMSMFYSSRGHKAWAVKSVAAKWNNFWTKSSFSASIESHALVSWRWFNRRCQSELTALCWELFFKRPSAFAMFGIANVVGLLNVYKRLTKVILTALLRSMYSLLLGNWSGRRKVCSSSWQITSLSALLSIISSLLSVLC